MAAKSLNQMELDLPLAQDVSSDARSSVPPDAPPSTATVLTFSGKPRRGSVNEERRLLDAISERASHLLHVLKRDL